MKTQRFLPIVLAGIVLMLLNACATYPKSGQSALVGTWTNSLGTVWTIKADGSFDVDLAGSPPGLPKRSSPGHPIWHFVIDRPRRRADPSGLAATRKRPTRW